VLHSAVACAELAISAGLPEPSHPGTAQNRAAITNLLGTIAAIDIVAPSPEAWAEGGMIAGILARTQYSTLPRHARTPERTAGQDGLRRRLLNDTLLFLGAHERGAILVSMDRADMSLLLRFRPDARVLGFAAVERINPGPIRR